MIDHNNCIFCNVSTKNSKFCSHSCRAKFYNPIILKDHGHCKTCKTPLSWNNRYYCSRKCELADKFNYTVSKFRLGEIESRNTLRKVLIHINGNSCAQCELTTWCNKPITLQVDHIDGNATNNIPSNLRLLCPNCHSQTPSFGGRNKGFGRGSRGMCLG